MEMVARRRQRLASGHGGLLTRRTRLLRRCLARRIKSDRRPFTVSRYAMPEPISLWFVGRIAQYPQTFLEVVAERRHAH